MNVNTENLQVTTQRNLRNAGFFGFGSMILAMGICCGGTAQVINEVYGKTVVPV